MELKPCPFCGGEAELSTSVHPPWERYAVCKKCAVRTLEYDYNTPEKAAEDWNRRYEPPNPPLTLDELRQMDGEPVWCVDGNGNACWCLVRCYYKHMNCYDKETGFWDEDFYGMAGDGQHGLHEVGWLAYRRRPEGG